MHATNEKKAEKLLKCPIALEKCASVLLDQTLIDGIELFVLCNFHNVQKHKQNEVRSWQL